MWYSCSRLISKGFWVFIVIWNTYHLPQTLSDLPATDTIEYDVCWTIHDVIDGEYNIRYDDGFLKWKMILSTPNQIYIYIYHRGWVLVLQYIDNCGIVILSQWFIIIWTMWCSSLVILQPTIVCMTGYEVCAAVVLNFIILFLYWY